MGNEAYKKKDFETAHVHYGKAIELDPTNITFYTNNAGKYSSSLFVYSYSLACYFEESKYDECIEECKKGIEAGREHRADFILIAKYDFIPLIWLIYSFFRAYARSKLDLSWLIQDVKHLSLFSGF